MCAGTSPAPDRIPKQLTEFQSSSAGVRPAHPSARLRTSVRTRRSAA
ncbi:hypothetical protein ACFPRL_00740 [Pseudoclavibacter helvolus]